MRCGSQSATARLSSSESPPASVNRSKGVGAPLGRRTQYGMGDVAGRHQGGVVRDRDGELHVGRRPHRALAQPGSARARKRHRARHLGVRPGSSPVMLRACTQRVSSRTQRPMSGVGPRHDGSPTSVGRKRLLRMKERPGVWLFARRTMTSCAMQEGSPVRRTRWPRSPRVARSTSSSPVVAVSAPGPAGTQVAMAFVLVSLAMGDRPPDEGRPFGYGKVRFFWAFVAAIGTCSWVRVSPSCRGSAA
jgi:hypothetical protein